VVIKTRRTKSKDMDGATEEKIYELEQANIIRELYYTDLGGGEIGYDKGQWCAL
jgi:hypothetical protein